MYKVQGFAGSLQQECYTAVVHIVLTTTTLLLLPNKDRSWDGVSNFMANPELVGLELGLVVHLK